jgi:hypothetical protein
MALTDVRLSMLAFPQAWTAGSLSARVLLLPAGDPLSPPGLALPAFAGTSWPLRVTILPAPDALLGPTPGAAAGAITFTFTATPPATAAPLFAALQARLAPVPPDPLAQRKARAATANVRKHLPDSYTRAFPFERPGPGTSVGNEFGCALRETKSADPADPKPPDTLTWGAVLSFALRQPLVARALGLIYDIPFPAAVPGPLEAGGWLYVDLAPGGAVQPTSPLAVRSYAARIPILEAGTDRGLFAAVLLPVGLTSAGDYGTALSEASVYADGFARIVHAAQAVTADAASSGHNELRPATDAGVDLGWDDEQVTAWLNRQLDALRARLNPSVTAMEAPLGVAGYRLDVRLPDVPQFAGWQSLCRAFSADSQGAPAPLLFPPDPDEPVVSIDFDGELTVEPAPVRSIHAANATAWLPQHFTRWQGGSLVANDPTLFLLTGATPGDANGNPLSVGAPTYAASPPRVPLRYGTRYEFRCRLADLTGGGPTAGDDPVSPAPAPIARTRFLRHVPPKPVRLETDVPRPGPGEATPAVPTVTTIDVWRPIIGYPEMVFAGIDDPAVVGALLANAGAARAAGDAVGANDPDVTHLRVSVQVRAAAHDPGPAGVRDGDFRTLYTVEIPFPPFDPNAVLAKGAALTLTLDYQEVRDVAAFAAPAAGTTNLPVPRAREVRLRLAPHCADKPDYFGAPWVQEGLTADVATRANAEDEDGLFAPEPAEHALNAILLQPAEEMVLRLADHLDLAANGLTLTARPGERVVFAASAAIRHTVAPDRGSLTFASRGELLGHWLSVVQAQIARDWTWDGLDDEGFVIQRRDAAGDPFRIAGNAPVPFAVPSLALAGDETPGIDRRAGTRVVFFDAVDPQPAEGQFPAVLTPEWSIEPRVRGFAPADNAALGRTLAIKLPIAAPPRQTPRLVSAGLALSPYHRAPDYSSTEARRRVLWFELDAPVEDANDALFARVLAYGPDPLLSGAITHLLLPVPALPIGPTTLFDIVQQALPNPPAPPPLAIDPEPMRVIVPGQPEDGSGLDAMLAMTEGVPQAGDPRARHFIVPLPPGIDPEAPELFGFWTYELRIGHRLLWSTAQARFGRPLAVNGVQHPAPTLLCSAFRAEVPPGGTRRVVVTAPFATAVFADQRLTRIEAGDPRTRLWVLLYAQVRQADGDTSRNLLIARAPASPRFEVDALGKAVAPRTRDLVGVAEFDVSQIEDQLALLALPRETPLSALAVELLPGDRLVQREVAIRDEKVYLVFDQPEVTGASQFAVVNVGTPSDPLGAELGTITSRRILRCSPLTPVAPAC